MKTLLFNEKTYFFNLTKKQEKIVSKYSFKEKENCQFSFKGKVFKLRYYLPDANSLRKELLYSELDGLVKDINLKNRKLSSLKALQYSSIPADIELCGILKKDLGHSIYIEDIVKIAKKEIEIRGYYSYEMKKNKVVLFRTDEGYRIIEDRDKSKMKLISPNNSFMKEFFSLKEGIAECLRHSAKLKYDKILENSI